MEEWDLKILLFLYFDDVALGSVETPFWKADHTCLWTSHHRCLRGSFLLNLTGNFTFFKYKYVEVGPKFFFYLITEMIFS